MAKWLGEVRAAVQARREAEAAAHMEDQRRRAAETGVMSRLNWVDAALAKPGINDLTCPVCLSGAHLALHCHAAHAVA